MELIDAQPGFAWGALRVQLLLLGNENPCVLQPQLLISWGWVQECKVSEELFEREEH